MSSNIKYIRQRQPGLEKPKEEKIDINSRPVLNGLASVHKVDNKVPSGYIQSRSLPRTDVTTQRSSSSHVRDTTRTVSTSIGRNASSLGRAKLTRLGVHGSSSTLTIAQEKKSNAPEAQERNNLMSTTALDAKGPVLSSHVVALRKLEGSSNPYKKVDVESLLRRLHASSHTPSVISDKHKATAETKGSLGDAGEESNEDEGHEYKEDEFDSSEGEDSEAQDQYEDDSNESYDDDNGSDEQEDEEEEDDDEDEFGALGNDQVNSKIMFHRSTSSSDQFQPSKLLLSVLSKAMMSMMARHQEYGVLSVDMGQLTKSLEPPSQMREFSIQLLPYTSESKILEPLVPDLFLLDTTLDESDDSMGGDAELTVEFITKVLARKWIYAAQQLVQTSKLRSKIATFVTDNLCIAAGLHPPFVKGFSDENKQVSLCCRSCQSFNYERAIRDFKEKRGTTDAFSEVNPLLVGLSFVNEPAFRDAANMSSLNSRQSVQEPTVEEIEALCSKREPGCFACVRCALDQGLCSRCGKVVMMSSLAVPADGALASLALVLIGSHKMANSTQFKKAIYPTTRRKLMAPAAAARRRFARKGLQSLHASDHADGSGYESGSDSDELEDISQTKVPSYDDDEEIEDSASDMEIRDILQYGCNSDVEDDEFGIENDSIQEHIEGESGYSKDGANVMIHPMVIKNITEQLQMMLGAHFAAQL